MATTYAADTFTRADGPVGNAEIGGAWTASGAAATWAVASNQLTGQSTTGYAALLTVDDGQSDGAIQATFVGGNGGLVFRRTSAKDYWVLTFNVGNSIRLSYFLSGYTLKAQPGVVAAAGDVFRIELTGPAIVVYRNGKQIISITDSTRVAATSHGLLATGSGVAKFDNFSHYSLTSTPTPTPTPTPTGTVHRYFNIGGTAVPVS